MITVMNSLFLLTILALFISCGKSVEDKTDDDKPRLEESLDGTYSAVLLPMNPSISNNVSGEAKVFKYGDSFRVEVRLRNSPGGIHKQYLQTGTSCSDPGAKLLPLDDDLSGQFRGYRSFPSGSYQYRRSTSYYLMLSDLHLPDENNNDDVVKLESWDLTLEQRPIVVYAKSGEQDKIMACGILTKTSTNENQSPNWETDSSGRPSPGRIQTRPRPRPRPAPPQPEPEVIPEPTTPEYTSWWERMRERWRRWRDRIRGQDPETNFYTT